MVSRYDQNLMMFIFVTNSNSHKNPYFCMDEYSCNSILQFLKSSLVFITNFVRIWSQKCNCVPWNQFFWKLKLPLWISPNFTEYQSSHFSNVFGGYLHVYNLWSLFLSTLGIMKVKKWPFFWFSPLLNEIQ